MREIMAVDPEVADQWLDGFESLWLEGEVPDLASYVENTKSAFPAEAHQTIISELVALDLEYRWKHRLKVEPSEDVDTQVFEPTADDYLSSFPILRSEPQCIVDLLWHEFVVRDASGYRPSTDEQYRRFFPLHQRIDEYDAERERDQDKQFAVIELISGPLVGKVLVVRDPARIVVGRGRTCDLVIRENPHMSRSHLRLDISPPDASVVDLESKNGTRVNDQIIDKAQLVDGDIITVGPSEILVRMLTNSELEAFKKRKHADDSDTESDSSLP